MHLQWYGPCERLRSPFQSPSAGAGSEPQHPRPVNRIGAGAKHPRSPRVFRTGIDPLQACNSHLLRTACAAARRAHARAGASAVQEHRPAARAAAGPDGDAKSRPARPDRASRFRRRDSAATRATRRTRGRSCPSDQDFRHPYLRLGCVAKLYESLVLWMRMGESHGTYFNLYRANLRCPASAGNDRADAWPLERARLLNHGPIYY